MLIAVLSGFVLALIAPLVNRYARGFSGWLLALVPIGLFVYFSTFASQVFQGESIILSYPWVTTLDIHLAFLVDGLSLMMVLIVTGIGALIYIYGGGYLKGDPLLGRFYMYLSLFMAAMVGLVLANNLLTLFIFWELTSISSYLLIGYKHNYADSRRAALTALFVTGAGGLALLAGLVLMGIAGGTLDISTILSNPESIQQSSLYMPILILVLLGAFTKSAQVPFHFWLPGAMAAPTPVSAYLHSATMVKAGVYLLARLSPALSGTEAWQTLLIMFGGATMLIGGMISLKHTDLKRILAYSTVSSLGTLVMLLGYGTKVAVEAAMLFLLVHSLYKGALFMIAGSIDHEAGTRDINSLGGLLRIMPFTALAAGLAALSMAGIPPFLGFIGKELIYEATLAYQSGEPLVLEFLTLALTAVAFLTNVAFIAVAFIVSIKPFFGEQKETPKHPHRAPIAMWLGPIVLGLVGLGFGLSTGIPSSLISSSATAVYASPIDLKLSLWHGVNPMLILSIITVATGALVFWQLKRLVPVLDAADIGPRFGPERAFNRMIDRLPYFSNRLASIFQNGYLRYYVATIVSTLVILVGYVLITRVELPPLDFPNGIFLHEILIALVILVGIVVVLQSKRLLHTVVALGVIGYGIALIFMFFGAPDLAMTQFSIETLSVILFVLVLLRLPDLAQLSTLRARIRDGVIAVIGGGLVAILVLVITSEPANSRLTDYFADASYKEAQGRNIVNVILVDFRALDTMGEIVVVAIAAMGVLAMLRLRLTDKEEPEEAPVEE